MSTYTNSVEQVKEKLIQLECEIQRLDDVLLLFGYWVYLLTEQKLYVKKECRQKSKYSNLYIKFYTRRDKIKQNYSCNVCIYIPVYLFYQ